MTSFIRKDGYYYRDGAHGYTKDLLFAGLFTDERADAEARIEKSIEAIRVGDRVDELQAIIDANEARTAKLRGLLAEISVERDTP